MKFAWIENNRIRDIAQGNPTEIYHPDVAAHYTTQVPDNAVNGDGWVGGQLVKPEPAPEPAPAPRTWAAADIRAGLTLSEKVKWDSDATPEIATVKSEFAAPQKLESATELLQFLVDTAVITQASMNKVLE